MAIVIYYNTYNNIINEILETAKPENNLSNKNLCTTRFTIMKIMGFSFTMRFTI